MCVVLISAASVCNKFASTFQPAAFVFRGKKTRRQKPSHEEAEQNGAHRSRPQSRIKNLLFHGHSPAPGPPQPRVCMKTKGLALLNDCKDCLLIQTLTLLYCSAPAFPLLQEGVGGVRSNRTEQERRRVERERREKNEEKGGEGT